MMPHGGRASYKRGRSAMTSDPQRVWTLHKGDHAAAIDLKVVPGIGAEIVLTVDGELRKTRCRGCFGRTSRRTGRRDCGHADDVRGKEWA
jgi:hypothetical protein